MAERKRVPVVQRFHPNGNLKSQVAGATAALKDGDDVAGDSVTWTLYPKTLGGFMPEPGDVLTDVHGNAWRVVGVETVVASVAGHDGGITCVCERVKDGGEK